MTFPSPRKFRFELLLFCMNIKQWKVEHGTNILTYTLHSRGCNLFVHECMGGTSFLANVNLSNIVAVTYHTHTQ